VFLSRKLSTPAARIQDCQSYRNCSLIGEHCDKTEKIMGCLWRKKDEARGISASAFGRRPGGTRKNKKECLEGESNSHLRITQAELGHIL
jgi:hypothetical protein